jgi:hypothetical protein
MDRSAVRVILCLECVNAVEPNAERIGTVWVKISHRRGNATAIPFLAIHRARVTTDTDVEVDDKA